jgi:hypothetical protein
MRTVRCIQEQSPPQAPSPAPDHAGTYQQCKAQTNKPFPRQRVFRLQYFSCTLSDSPYANIQAPSSFKTRKSNAGHRHVKKDHQIPAPRHFFAVVFSVCVMHDLPNPQTRRREKADFDRSGKPWSVSVLFHAANSMWICERLCWRSMHLGYVCCRKPVSSQVDLSKLIQNFVVAVKRESMIMLCF